MIPFQLHRRIPFVRRPFFQRDQALLERDLVAADRDRLIAEREMMATRDRQAMAERDMACIERETPRRFSLMRLLEENAHLARRYLWSTNPSLSEHAAPWLHLGCGVRVLDGFINLDIDPPLPAITTWNLLDLWPEEMDESVAGVFSEDCLEHFFHGEQTYILCNINRALAPGRVARIIMPRLQWPIDTSSDYYPAPGEFLSSTYGVETLADAFNYGMRFTGHRWLHDQRSFEHMGALCGFDVTPTRMANSTVDTFNGLNLRDESHSFANDLRKERHISRILVAPTSVDGAQKVEDLAEDAALFVATSGRPTVEYELPQRIAADSVVCINFRSSNLSSFDWGLKKLIIDGINDTKPWCFDETLKSQLCMNVITKSQIRLTVGKDKEFSRLRFSPANYPDEYFTVGCAELFVLN